MINLEDLGDIRSHGWLFDTYCLLKKLFWYDNPSWEEFVIATKSLKAWLLMQLCYKCWMTLENIATFSYLSSLIYPREAFKYQAHPHQVSLLTWTSAWTKGEFGVCSLQRTSCWYIYQTFTQWSIRISQIEAWSSLCHAEDQICLNSED